MTYQKKNIPLQRLPNGEVIAIQAHIFSGNQPGPKVYLQGNLHGPEVFGTALLVELIQGLKKKKSLKGQIVVVPCANPMAVNQVAYNSMTGRWNAQSGVNWNRIFPITPLKNHTEEKAFYKKLLQTKNPSSAQKLAATLRSLSAGANYVLDIHTTGSSNAEHLFTYPHMHSDFGALKVSLHLTLDTKEAVGAFDESHVIPFLDSLPQNQLPKVATWEAHHHGHIDSILLKQRLSQLLNWLDSVWEKEASKTEPEIYSGSAHLQAPLGGYYSWIKKVGDKINFGDTYAYVYQPNGNIVPAKALRNFTLLGIYGVSATAEGEEIGWIAY